MNTTIDLSKCYMLLKEAKITKLDDSDKILVIKAMRELRPIYNGLETDEREAGNKIKGENHDEIMKLVNIYQAHQKDSSKPDITPELIKLVDTYFNKYYKTLNTYLNEIHNAEVETTFKKLSEEAVNSIIVSNDFNCELSLLLQDILME